MPLNRARGCPPQIYPTASGADSNNKPARTHGALLQTCRHGSVRTGLRLGLKWKEMEGVHAWYYHSDVVAYMRLVVMTLLYGYLTRARGPAEEAYDLQAC